MSEDIRETVQKLRNLGLDGAANVIERMGGHINFIELRLMNAIQVNAALSQRLDELEERWLITS